MKLLLDTHTFIWWASSPNRIPDTTLALMRQPENQLWISLVSIWEIQIKHQLGKLELHLPLTDILAQQQANGIQLLSVTLQHILALDHLPQYHRDPFDRLLISQSRLEAATLVSRDPMFQQYECHVIWDPPDPG